MKRFVSVLIACMLFVSLASADSFGLSVKRFVAEYNYQSDKRLESIDSGTVFGSGDSQYMRLNADTGVDIFLRYADSVDSDLTGIIVMQDANSTDMEKFISVCTTATYVLSGYTVDPEDFTRRYYQPYFSVCSALSYYGYSGKSSPVSVIGYTVQYQIQDGNRQLAISPNDQKE